MVENKTRYTVSLDSSRVRLGSGDDEIGFQAVGQVMAVMRKPPINANKTVTDQRTDAQTGEPTDRQT